MLYCNGIEELFETNSIYVDKDGDLMDITPNSLYHIEDGILYFKNRISVIDKIFEYKNGEFKLLYEKPNLLDISTIIKNGDFINEMAKNKYLFYACYKNGHNGGVYYDGKKTAQEAKDDLLKLVNTYLTNDVVFMGIVKCSDGKPLDHIQNLNS